MGVFTVTKQYNQEIDLLLTVPSGATHLWPMTDAQVSGTTIIDTIGGDNGTAGSSVSSTSGPPGGSTARLFDNDANTYCTLGSNPIADFTQALTIACWLNPTNINTHPYDAAGSTTSWFEFIDSNGGWFNIRPGNSTSNFATANVTPFDGVGIFSVNSSAVALSGYPLGVANVQVSGQWVHVAITQQAGPSTVTVYLNGASVSTTTPTTRTFLGTLNTIGAADAPGGVSARPAIAAMAQFIIYPRALSASEVAALYALLR